MPTNEELLDRASQCASSGTFDYSPWSDGELVSESHRQALVLIVRYLCGLRSLKSADHRKAQRRAMRLLRSLLSPAQRAMLRTRSEFLAVCPSGNVYRLYPRTGMVWRVDRHGKNWYVRTAYCIHEDKESGIPPADRTIAHLLLLLTDEEEFLRTANARNSRDQMWNSEYLRKIRHRSSVATADSPT